MKKVKLKEIKNLVEMGAAVDITGAEPSDYIRKNADKIAVSTGVYGMNGGILKDRNNGALYAITARSSTLFYYF